MNKELKAVFIAHLNKNNTNGEVYYIMKEEDAIKFCTNDQTKGVNWAFHWTALENYTNEKGEFIKRYFKNKDDGRFDELMIELDIRNFTLKEVIEQYKK